MDARRFIVLHYDNLGFLMFEKPQINTAPLNQCVKTPFNFNGEDKELILGYLLAFVRHLEMLVRDIRERF